MGHRWVTEGTQKVPHGSHISRIWITDGLPTDNGWVTDGSRMCHTWNTHSPQKGHTHGSPKGRGCVTDG